MKYSSSENPKQTQAEFGEGDKKSETIAESKKVEEISDAIIKEAEVLLGENKKAGELLSNSDIPDDKRAKFTDELNSFRDGIVSLMQRVGSEIARIARKPAEMLGRVGSELKSASEVVMLPIELRRSLKVINFILDNIEFKDVENLKKELAVGYFTLPDIHFPLNSKGLKIFKALMKKEPVSLTGVIEIVEHTNAVFDLMKNGISLETLQRIRINYFTNFQDIFNNPNIIEKLKYLDKMDFKGGDNEIDFDDLNIISLEQMRLLSENTYVTFTWNDSRYFRLSYLAKILTEENLAKLKEFNSNISTISIYEFIQFVTKISDLPLEIQEMCKTEFSNGKKMNQLIPYSHHEELKVLDKNGVIRFKDLIAHGVIGLDYMPNLEKYLSLSNHVFDRCKILGEDVKEVLIDHLIDLDSLSEEEFHLFKNITETRKGYIRIGNNLKLTKEIVSILGVADGHLFVEWLVKGNRQEFGTIVFDKFVMEHLIKRIIEASKSQSDINMFDLVFKAYGANTLVRISKDNKIILMTTWLKDNPELVIPDILSEIEGLENTFINFKSVQEMLSKKGIHFTEDDIANLFSGLLSKKPTVLLELNTFPLTEEHRKSAIDVLIDRSLIEVIQKYSVFEKEYLQYSDNREKDLERLFEKAIRDQPLILLASQDFPFTPEQKQYLEIFKKVQESPSRELKNLAAEIIPLVAKYKTIEEANEVLGKIEQIFLTNNIPLVGKQYKVFEILYPNERLSAKVSRSKVDSLKRFDNPSAQRLVIFKDLMRAHIASADSNLEQYLIALKDGKEVLSKFESGTPLSDTEKNTLKLFIKKINVLSGHIGRKSIGISADLSDEEMTVEIINLGEAFGVREGESIIERFERTFLKRIDIDSIEQALELMEEYRNQASLRNEKHAEAGVIKLEEGDLVKNISGLYLDSYLDRGIYAPEFIGAESDSAKHTSINGDSSPFDTDMLRVSADRRDIYDLFNSAYGGIMLVVKQKEQFVKDGLDVLKLGIINDKHYGIRTGFGSTQIDAICIKKEEWDDIRIDELKYFIAKKGFYIPICNLSGEVIFTKEEFDQQRKIFSGIDRFHGEVIDLSDAWESSNKASEIQGVAQTAENIESVTKVRDTVMSKIQSMLAEEGVVLNKGKYDDSLKGAVITDTGSTGRGSSLDEKLDFDFAIKLDDTDWDKVSALMEKLGIIFPKVDQYESGGMMMFRSGEIEINGFKMTIDIGFNKKSDSEEFDAHDALKEKYNSIKNKNGEQSYFDVLSNIRFAKKKLKEAGCYKKGAGGEGQQGGLGGIGVEYWILQNGGDAIAAFNSFRQHAFKDGLMVPFEEFKRQYKIFSAGQNIRGAVKVENFTDNMTEEGYRKMAELARDLAESKDLTK